MWGEGAPVAVGWGSPSPWAPLPTPNSSPDPHGACPPGPSPVGGALAPRSPLGGQDTEPPKQAPRFGRMFPAPEAHASETWVTRHFPSLQGRRDSPGDQYFSSNDLHLRTWCSPCVSLVTSIPQVSSSESQWVTKGETGKMVKVTPSLLPGRGTKVTYR